MTILAVVCFEDLKYRKIYNKRLLLLIPFLIVSKLYNDVNYIEWMQVIKPAIIISAVFLIMAFRGLVGMGDVKLLMVLMPFIPYENIRDFLVIFLLLGGVLAVFQLLFLNKIFLKLKLSAKGVPYGVPIIASYMWFSGIIIH